MKKLPSMTELRCSKRDMRSKIAELLKTVSTDQILNESKSVYNQVLRNAHYQNARRVSIYVNMPSGEVTTDSLIRHALREKKTVFIPFFEKGDKQMNMLRLKDEDAFEKLATSLWGIPQHCSISDAATYSDDGSPNPLDLVIVPGMAFTKRGKRLGHGMGYYDRFLSSYSSKYGRSPTTIGLSLSTQIVEDLPQGPNDITLDVVVCPSN